MAWRASFSDMPRNTPRWMMLSAPVNSGSMPISMSIRDDTVPVMSACPVDGS
jgi:hypothetical protein